MTTDQAFLQALLHAPRDSTHRLVYADWLEERGDLRAELLRLDVELERIANAGEWDRDLYQLREDFGADLDPDWLAAVNAVNDRRGRVGYSVHLLGDEFSVREVGWSGGPGTDYDSNGSELDVSAHSRREREEGHPEWSIWICLRSTSPHVVSVGAAARYLGPYLARMNLACVLNRHRGLVAGHDGGPSRAYERGPDGSWEPRFCRAQCPHCGGKLRLLRRRASHRVYCGFCRRTGEARAIPEREDGRTR